MSKKRKTASKTAAKRAAKKPRYNEPANVTRFEDREVHSANGREFPSLHQPEEDVKDAEILKVKQDHNGKIDIARERHKKKKVQWILPQRALRQGYNPGALAPRLFGEQWNHVTNIRKDEKLESALILSPAIRLRKRKKAEKPETGPIPSPANRLRDTSESRRTGLLAHIYKEMRETHMYNQSSKNLIHFSRKIQRWASGPSESSTVAKVYGPEKLDNTFGGDDEDVAIIARDDPNVTKPHDDSERDDDAASSQDISEQINDPVIALTGDYRITVAIDREPAGASSVGLGNSIDIIRFGGDEGSENNAQSGGGQDRNQYLIRVPHGVTVTINSQIFSNERLSRPGRRHDHQSDLWIGPIEEFAAIELLNQPIFFWRRREDLNYVNEKHGPVEEDEEKKQRKKMIERALFGMQKPDLKFEDLEQFQYDQNLDGKKDVRRRNFAPLLTPNDPIPNFPTEAPPDESAPEGPPRSPMSGIPPLKDHEMTQEPPVTASSEQASHAVSDDGVRLHNIPIGTDELTQKPLFSASSPTSETLQAPPLSHASTQQKSSKNLPDNTRADEASNFFGSSPCDYLRSQLSRLQNKSGQEFPIDWTLREIHFTFFKLLLGAINDLQPSCSGFCIVPIGMNNNGFTVQITEGNADNYRLSDESTSLIRPGRPLLIPMEIEHHTVLAVVQTENGRTATLTILDSSIDTLSQDNRNRLNCEVVTILRRTNWWHTITHTEEEIRSLEPREARWMPSAQSNHPDRSFLHAILNGSALALGLELETSYTPTEKFFTDADAMIRLILLDDGFNWTLLLALFQCHGFVKKNPSLPPTDRRFSWAKSIANDLSRRNVEKETSKRDLTEEDLTQRTLLTLPNEVSHEDEIPMAGLIQQEATLDENQDKLSEYTNPCDYFKQRLAQLLQNENVKRELDNLRCAGITTKRGQWLQNEEVLLAIASVTQGIRKLQAHSGGFSIVEPVFIEGLCQSDNEVYCPQEAVRFGRPMLLPLNLYGTDRANHIILLIIQFDDKLRPTIAVLDSKSWHYHERERQVIFNRACRLLRASRWWRHFYDTYEDVPKPKAASWVRCAIQPSDDECGYCVIFNAWALALGLEINPERCGKWSDDLFQDALNVVHLARIGHADWTLIQAFLKCHKFVRTDGIVKEERKIINTLSLLNETNLENALNTLLSHEEEYWRHRTMNKHDIADRNRIPNLNGISHDDRNSFLSDSWSYSFQMNDAFNLANSGLLDLSKNEQQLKRLYDQEIKKAGTINQQFKKGKHSNCSEKEMEDLQRIELDPCSHFKQQRDDLRKKLEKNRKTLSYQIGDEEVTAAIASVIGAIDHLQSELHDAEKTRTPFNGGFSLANAFAIESARLGQKFAEASRPRRCWIVPFVVAGDLAKKYNKRLPEGRSLRSRCGHTVLLVIQEESVQSTSSSSARSKFQAYILDSAPNILLPARHLILETAILMADTIGWSEHRNKDKAVRFDTRLINIQVPLQGKTGELACNLHTIVNAWILAMGLQPNPQANFDEKLYDSLWDLIHTACSGQLDWKTLIAFFFCFKLTVETSFTAVPKDRQFNFTQSQGLFDSLSNTIAVAERDDNWLELQTIARVPYDHSNNIKFSSGGPPPPISKPTQQHVVKTPHSKEKICSHFMNQLSKYADLSKNHDQKYGQQNTLPSYEALPRSLLEDEQVMLSIASVVAAIDSHQKHIYVSSDDHGLPFNSGLTLATAYSVSEGLGTLNPSSQVSRPRRCWIMPIVYDGSLHELYETEYGPSGMGSGVGHIFLAVVQEEPMESDPQRTEFRIYFLDSSPEYLNEMSHFLSWRIQEAAASLSWQSKSGSDRTASVTFSETYYYATVPRQQTGWSCGLHVIFNAWILALGLTPAPTFSAGTNAETIYSECYKIATLALKGLMDWETLAAWLICRGLVVQTELHAVPVERRFARSTVLPNEARLQALITSKVEDDDDLLETLPEDIHGYRRNNVDFSKMMLRSETIDWDEGEDDLQREYSRAEWEFEQDNELDFLESYASDGLDFFDDASDDGMDFLDQESRDDDVVMSNYL